MKKIDTLTISVRTHFKWEDIADLLDSASRGAAYWCENELDYQSTTDNVARGGEALIHDKEEQKTYKLDTKRVKMGLTVMAKKEPQHFADFLTENYDQNTGDVFLQFCLFGEVIYG